MPECANIPNPGFGIMDRFTSMTVFVRVAEAGGFVAAARDLEISATMVGKHIKALEGRLGARLIHRTTRRQNLTEVGRLYYERCTALLASLAAAESSAEELRATPRGLLRIAAPLTFGARKVAPVLGEFLRLHPEVHIELALSDDVLDLVEHGFDAAIRIGALSDSGMVARPLGTYRMLVCASPSYLAARGVPRTPDDLARHDCLGFTAWRRRELWRFQGRSEEISVRIRKHLQINHGEALRQAALAGAGIVMQPEVLLADDVQTGRLVRLLRGYEPEGRPIHLVYLQDRRAPLKLRRFIEFAVERLGRSPA